MDVKKKPKTKKKVEKKAVQEERDAASDAGAVSSDECEAEISLEAESKAWSAQQLLRDGKRKRLRSYMSCSGSEATLSDEEAPAPKVGTSRKGRSLPPKTGETEELAKAKAELLDVRRDESRLQVVEDVNALVKDIRRRSNNIFTRTDATPTRTELTDLVLTGLKTVAAVGQGSGNLKGTFVRALKEATNEIQKSVLCLCDMTVDDQVRNYESYITRVHEDKRRLKADNDKLKGDQKKMREELDAVKVELEVIRRQGPSASVVTPPAESELLRLFRAEMATLTARFAVIEGKILRPPLAGDCRVADQTPAVSYAAKASTSRASAAAQAPKKTAPSKAASSKGAPVKAAPSTVAPPKAAPQQVEPVESQSGSTPQAATSKSQPKGKGKGKGGKSQDKAANNAAASTQDAQSANNTQQGEWQTVKNKKKAAKKRSQKKKAAAKLRVPNSTAVVIALQPGAQEKGISYLSVLTEAKTQPAAVDSPNAEGWTTVTKKKRRKRGGNKNKNKGKSARSGANDRPPKVSAPRSAAVVITLQPEAVKRGVTYKAVLAEAKAKVQFPDLGISTGFRFRTSLAGARVLELPAAASGETADALAAKLREALKPEDVRVSRPVKTVGLRVFGLDDSVASEEVIAAICERGGCLSKDVQAGQIRWGSDGSGAVVVRCPVEAANKVAEAGRLLVGWSSAGVKLLKPKAMRCYRCMDSGHVRATCTAAVDRSDLCHRCGRPGHKAAECTAKPNCCLCAAAGRRAGHEAGGKACRAPPASKRGRNQAVGGSAHPSQPSCPSADSRPGEGGLEEMEC